MRKVELCSDEMKIAKKNLADIWEDMKWDEKSLDEMSWDEAQVWFVESGVWKMQWEEWRKCSLGVALRQGPAQVMFLDKFYRWEESYSITLRQLPLRLVRVLPVTLQMTGWFWNNHPPTITHHSIIPIDLHIIYIICIYIYICIYICMHIARCFMKPVEAASPFLFGCYIFWN